MLAASRVCKVARRDSRHAPRISGRPACHRPLSKRPLLHSPACDGIQPRITDQRYPHAGVQVLQTGRAVRQKHCALVTQQRPLRMALQMAVWALSATPGWFPPVFEPNASHRIDWATRYIEDHQRAATAPSVTCPKCRYTRSPGLDRAAHGASVGRSRSTNRIGLRLVGSK